MFLYERYPCLFYHSLRHIFRRKYCNCNVESYKNLSNEFNCARKYKIGFPPFNLCFFFFNLKHLSISKYLDSLLDPTWKKHWTGILLIVTYLILLKTKNYLTLKSTFFVLFSIAFNNDSCKPSPPSPTSNLNVKYRQAMVISRQKYEMIDKKAPVALISKISIGFYSSL